MIIFDMKEALKAASQTKPKRDGDSSGLGSGDVKRQIREGLTSAIASIQENDRVYKMLERIVEEA